MAHYCPKFKMASRFVAASRVLSRGVATSARGRAAVVPESVQRYNAAAGPADAEVAALLKKAEGPWGELSVENKVACELWAPVLRALASLPLHRAPRHAGRSFLQFWFNRLPLAAARAWPLTLDQRSCFHSNLARILFSWLAPPATCLARQHLPSGGLRRRRGRHVRQARNTLQRLPTEPAAAWAHVVGK